MRLDHAKGNYSARDRNVRWFELESFNLRNGGGCNDELDDVFVDGDTVAVPKRWYPAVTLNETVDEAGNGAKGGAAQGAARLQTVRDEVVGAMSSDRCQLSTLLEAVAKKFGKSESTARDLIKKAIPEGVEAFAEASGDVYSLTIEREGRTAPHPIFIVRRLIRARADAA